MTRDNITRMAREAGIECVMVRPEDMVLYRFAALVAAAEREACAKAVLAIANDDAGNPYKQALRIGAEAIRARGQA